MEERLARDAERLRNAMDRGGCPEAVTRILLTILTADHELTREEYDTAETVIRGLKAFKKIPSARMREMVKMQARLLQVDRLAAVAALPQLLPTPEDRAEAMDVIDQYTSIAGRPLNADEVKCVEKILVHLKGDTDTAN